MKHLQLYEDFIKNEDFDNFDNLDEGWKSLAIGGLLSLATILPSSYIQASNTVKDGDKIESVKTNKQLSKKDIIKIIKKLSKDGFEVSVGAVPLKNAIEKLPDDGNYEMVNTLGQYQSGAEFSLTQLVNSKGRYKKIIKLYKNNPNSVEAIAIVLY